MSAFAWGLVASSSLLVGGVLALTLPIGKRALGLIMAFGAGVLISAVAYDLVEEAQSKAGGSGRVGYGLMAGALVFFLGDAYVDRAGGGDRKRSHGTGAGDGSAGGGSFALPVVLGIVLDGIPESIVIGLSLIGGEGVGVAVLAAVFLSNLPEAMAATAGLRVDGWAGARIFGLWAVVAVVCAFASLLGYQVLDGASPGSIAFVEAFAGGAILTMLADTMMPEAFEHGGKQVGLLTTLGFGLAFGVLLDAFVIRGTLVPAFMRLAGEANWWAPAPLRGLRGYQLVTRTSPAWARAIRSPSTCSL